MKYAPVIIPTMNRYNHFYACLESLERCTGSEHTDVYVALDYPPSEKYVDGWKEDISACRKFEDLPKACQDYVLYVEKQIGLWKTDILNKAAYNADAIKQAA